MKSLDKRLIETASFGTTAELKALLDQGADIKAFDGLGSTALLRAVMMGNEDAIMLLLASGADVKAEDINGARPLNDVARRGLNDAVLGLIKAGADVNAKSCWGLTALHWAAGMYKTKAALILIDAGADVNALDERGQAPLDEAYMFRQGSTSSEKKATCLALISHGAKGNKPAKWAHDFNTAGMTMRQAAVQGGHVDRLLSLLDHHPADGHGDSPEALVKYAHHHGHSNAAAVLQAHIAAKAIEDILQPAHAMRAGIQ